MKYDVIIGGVGGQGTVLASRILAMAAMEAGYFVRTAETIGMAQRGGSVTSFVRIGGEKAGPVVPMGGGELLLGFELAEGTRCLPRLSKNGRGVFNTQVIEPVAVTVGKGRYDREGIIDFIRSLDMECMFIDAMALAAQAGSVRTVNSVMLGAACGFGQLPFSLEVVEEAIRKNLPERLHELNLRAFRLGIEESKKDKER